MLKRISKDSIDDSIWDIKYSLMSRYGTATSEEDMIALLWYIGRANTNFLKNLINADPVKIADLLHKGGSIEECVKRIKRYVRE